MEKLGEGKAANWLRSQPVHTILLYAAGVSFLIGILLGNATRVDMTALGLFLWVVSQITGE